MVVELLVGILLGIGVGAVGMWIREKQEYIRYVQEQWRRYSATASDASSTTRFKPGDDRDTPLICTDSSEPEK